MNDVRSWWFDGADPRSEDDWRPDIGCALVVLSGAVFWLTVLVLVLLIRRALGK